MMHTKSFIWFFVIAFALGLTFVALPQSATAQTTGKCQQAKDADDDDADENLSAEDKAKVKLAPEEARAIALKKVAGTVLDAELEKEKGQLQYAFDICDGNGKIWDVEIDAITGEVIQAEEDDKDDDTDTAARRNLKKAKKVVVKAAVAVKNVTVKAMDKVF